MVRIDFPSLDEVVGGLQVRESDSISDISMPLLQTVGDFFYLGENASLQNAGDFGSLTSVGGNFTVRNSGVLNSVGGFGVLSAVGSNFGITGNPALATCDAQALLIQLIVVGGTTTIAGNLADACGS